MDQELFDVMFMTSSEEEEESGEERLDIAREKSSTSSNVETTSGGELEMRPGRSRRRVVRDEMIDMRSVNEMKSKIAEAARVAFGALEHAWKSCLVK